MFLSFNVKETLRSKTCETYFREMRSFCIALTYLLFASADCIKAQVSLGLGPQVDFPLMYNAAVGNYNHSLGAFGAHFNIRYIPQNTTFYPSLAINTTTVRLPLVKLNDVVVNMRFVQINATIGVNGCKQLNNNAQVHYGIGVGISYLNGTGVELTGETGNRTPVAPPPYLDALMPAISLTGEYTIPISKEKPLYAGMGGNIQYIHFFDNGRKYSSTIEDPQLGAIPVHANLQGEMINPGIYLLVYYYFTRPGY